MICRACGEAIDPPGSGFRLGGAQYRCRRCQDKLEKTHYVTVEVPMQVTTCVKARDEVEAAQIARQMPVKPSNEWRASSGWVLVAAHVPEPWRRGKVVAIEHADPAVEVDPDVVAWVRDHFWGKDESTVAVDPEVMTADAKKEFEV